jgi:CHAT domain-containing protein
LSAKISSLKKNKEHKELVVLEKKYEKLLFSTNTNRNNLSIAIPSLEKVQKNLEKENYEIIQYLVQKTQLIVWHITKNKIDIKSVYLPQNELSQKVYSIYDTLKIQNGQKIFDEKSAKELFLFLIQPILKDIKSKHLVIVPHYELNHLPFQVLLNPETNQSLGEIFQISYAPSSSILMGLNRIENLKNKKIIAIGNSIMTDGNKEIKSIEKLYPNKVSIFNSITKEKLFKEIKGHNVVHISTHGKYEPTSPMLSYLELKNLNFTASEMFGMPLEKNSLVVLSACETGKVQFTQSNETLGMVRALLYAGADSLLLSSWKVDEQITALWMENFYKFARTETLVESARLALIEIKKKHPHPHYWAGFSMIGK